MTSRIFVTSDTHFGHANIIQHCKRPYASVEEMDAALVANWNATVTPQDAVYHLGDFCFGKPARISYLLAQLCGTKILIAGNHDKQARGDQHWSAVKDYAEIKSPSKIKVVLLHYPLLVWNGSHRGSIHLHGHSHGSLPPTNQRADVGVDVWNMWPTPLETVLAIMASWKPHQPADGHGTYADPE